MPLNNAAADALANKILDDLGVTPEQKAQALPMWKNICRDFFFSITQNAVVTVNSVSGVTTGGGVSGPGSGILS